MSDGDDNTDKTAKPAGGLMTIIVPPILAGVAAFGLAAYGPFGFGDPGQAATAPDAPQTEAVADADAAEKTPVLPVLASSDAKKAKGKKGDKSQAKAPVLLELEPFVISLATPGTGRTPRLRLVVAVEGRGLALAEPEVAAVVLRNEFTAAVRKVSPEDLGAPGALDLLRETFLQRANDRLGEGAIDAVLITDFLMT